jgi:L-asparaginase/Glu-tRNA(Gln) amidotransferase subunit D
MGLVPRIVSPAALRIPQHFPGGIELQDRAGITAGIGVVLLHQGAVGSLDFSCRGSGRHAQDAIGIGSSQVNASASDTALQATLGTQASELATIAAQQKTPA